MNRNFKIYLISNSINNKKYIGITKRKLHTRFSAHCSNGSSSIISKAIRKYGRENFKIEVLFQTFSLKDMELMENEFIKLYDSLTPHGYNNKSGGRYGTPTKLGKRSMSKSHKKFWKKMTPQQKQERLQLMTEGSAYRARPIIGVNRFDLSIKEYSTISSYIKEGLSWGSLNATLKGENKHSYNYCWFYKTHNDIELYKEEAIKRLGHMYKPNDIKRIVGQKDDIILEFNTLNEVVLKGFDKKSVRRVLKGERKEHKGYLWRFAA